MVFKSVFNKYYKNEKIIINKKIIKNKKHWKKYIKTISKLKKKTNNLIFLIFSFSIYQNLKIFFIMIFNLICIII